MRKANVFQTRHDRMRQAEILQEVSTDLDPTIIIRVQAAIAEEFLLCEMLHSQETRDHLLETFLAGKIKISTGTIEAVRIPVNLVLGEPS
jgi:hypothetical protein